MFHARFSSKTSPLWNGRPYCFRPAMGVDDGGSDQRRQRQEIGLVDKQLTLAGRAPAGPAQHAASFRAATGEEAIFDEYFSVFLKR